jgi:hypothetical protein
MLDKSRIKRQPPSLFLGKWQGLSSQPTDYFKENNLPTQEQDKACGWTKKENPWNTVGMWYIEKKPAQASRRCIISLWGPGLHGGGSATDNNFSRHKKEAFKA